MCMKYSILLCLQPWGAEPAASLPAKLGNGLLHHPTFCLPSFAYVILLCHITSVPSVLCVAKFLVYLVFEICRFYIFGFQNLHMFMSNVQLRLSDKYWVMAAGCEPVWWVGGGRACSSRRTPQDLHQEDQALQKEGWRCIFANHGWQQCISVWAWRPCRMLFSSTWKLNASVIAWPASPECMTFRPWTLFWHANCLMHMSPW